MADRYRTFVGALTTANTTIFTVPLANVAATPPVPVTTYIAQSVYVAHHDTSGGGNRYVTGWFVDYSNSNTATKVIQYDMPEDQAPTLLSPAPIVFEGGDSLIIQAEEDNHINYMVSVLEIKEQQ